MLRFRIHFEHQDGTEDSFDVSGGTEIEIARLAHAGLAERNGKNPWSAELKEEE